MKNLDVVPGGLGAAVTYRENDQICILELLLPLQRGKLSGGDFGTVVMWKPQFRELV